MFQRADSAGGFLGTVSSNPPKLCKACILSIPTLQMRTLRPRREEMTCLWSLDVLHRKKEHNKNHVPFLCLQVLQTALKA